MCVINIIFFFNEWYNGLMVSELVPGLRHIGIIVLCSRVRHLLHIITLLFLILHPHVYMVLSSSLEQPYKMLWQ